MPLSVCCRSEEEQALLWSYVIVFSGKTRYILSYDHSLPASSMFIRQTSDVGSAIYKAGQSRRCREPPGKLSDPQTESNGAGN